MKKEREPLEERERKKKEINDWIRGRRKK